MSNLPWGCHITSKKGERLSCVTHLLEFHHQGWRGSGSPASYYIHIPSANCKWFSVVVMMRVCTVCAPLKLYIIALRWWKKCKTDWRCQTAEQSEGICKRWSRDEKGRMRGRGQEGKSDEIKQDRRRMGRDPSALQRLVPSLTNILIFKVTLKLLFFFSVCAAASRTRWKKTSIAFQSRQ